MSRSPVLPRAALVVALGAAAFAGPVATAPAAELVVTVDGVPSSDGEIGCALFSSATGFPMQSDGVPQRWVRASKDGAVCKFENLTAGTYAVAVAHDLNGNHRTDTNLFGIPTEAWGVSNNVRPFMRPPRFDEAAVKLGADETLRVPVKVAR